MAIDSFADRLPPRVRSVAAHRSSACVQAGELGAALADALARSLEQ